MRRSEKKRVRNEFKIKEWAMKEAIKTIESFRGSTTFPIVTKSNKLFLLRKFKHGLFLPRGGIVSSGDIVTILDIFPNIRISYGRQQAELILLLLTGHGAGLVVFEKYQFKELTSAPFAFSHI